MFLQQEGEDIAVQHEENNHHINQFGVMLYIILFMMSVFNISSAYFVRKNIHIVHETSIALLLGIFVGIFAFYWKNIIFSLDEQMFFYILLPPIIFAEGFNIQKEKFFKIFGYALLYGALGTSLNFVIISLCNNFLNDFDHIKITHDILEINIGNVIKFDSYDILLLSTVLSAKDSFTISTMIDHHKRPTMHDIIFGEGIFNDSTTLIIFNIIFGNRNVINQSQSIGDQFMPILQRFFVDFFISVLIGLIHGILAALSLKHFRFLRESYMNEILIIFFFAYSSFAITEAIHYSGVLSLLVAGIITGDYAWFNLSNKAKITSGLMFQTISHASEGFMFFYLGSSLIGHLSKSWSSTLILYEILFIFFARFISLYGMTVTGWFLSGRKWILNWSEILVLYCSGLMRGILAYVLIEFVDESDQNSHVLITTVLGIVIIQTIVVGGIFPYLKDLIIPMTPEEEHAEHHKQEQIDERDHKSLMYLAKGNLEFNKDLFDNQWSFFWSKVEVNYFKPFLVFNYSEKIKTYELEKSLFKELRWDLMRPDSDMNIKKLKKELGKQKVHGEEHSKENKQLLQTFAQQHFINQQNSMERSDSLSNVIQDAEKQGVILHLESDKKEEDQELLPEIKVEQKNEETQFEGIQDQDKEKDQKIEQKQ